MARRLVVPKTARSEVWNYFGFEADESGTIADIYRRTVWCRLCDTQLLFSGNTTNLSAHIARCRRAPKAGAERTPPASLTVLQNNGPNVKLEVKQQIDESSQDAGEYQQVVSGEQDTSVDQKCDNEQKYCLKWKYHHSNQQTMFSKLLEQESFCDVTIACEEKLIRAHKLVLSACSSYFEMVLSHYEDQTPIIILKDVKFEDMSALMQFMYRGEINISQSQLSSLLETADVLKIKGLCDMYRGQVMEQPVQTEDLNSHTEEPMKRPFKDDEVEEEEEIIPHRPLKIARRTISLDSASVPIAQHLKPIIEQESPTTRLSDKKEDEELVIRLPDFLKGHGTYHEYWKKPFVIKALKAVSDREMTLRNCSDLLGVGYNILYSRYRNHHGYLKEPVFETVPSSSRSYTVKIVSTRQDKEQGGSIIVRRDQLVTGRKEHGGKIILRREELAPAGVLSVAKRELPSKMPSVVTVKVDSKPNECEEIEEYQALEPETSLTQEEV